VVALSAAAALAATALGCGVINRAKQTVGNLTAVSELAEKLKDSDKITFGATYKLFDGSTAKAAQQPPNSAVVGKDGRFIVTQEFIYLCSDEAGKTTCQKSKNTGEGQLNTSNAGLIPSVAGEGFVSAPIAVALLLAASVSPGAKVDKSEKKIAGQQSTCVKVSGIQPDTDPDTPDVTEFSACVTDNGVLAQFDGALSDGKRASVEMTEYSSSPDASLFKPPAGATIVDVDQLHEPN
jgi:hypothetical protein